MSFCLGFLFSYPYSYLILVPLALRQMDTLLLSVYRPMDKYGLFQISLCWRNRLFLTISFPSLTRCCCLRSTSRAFPSPLAGSQGSSSAGRAVGVGSKEPAVKGRVNQNRQNFYGLKIMWKWPFSHTSKTRRTEILKRGY